MRFSGIWNFLCLIKFSLEMELCTQNGRWSMLLNLASFIEDGRWKQTLRWWRIGWIWMILDVGWHNGDWICISIEKEVDFRGQPSHECSSVMVYSLFPSTNRCWNPGVAVQLSRVIAKFLILYLYCNPLNSFSGQNILATSMIKELLQALKWPWNIWRNDGDHAMWQEAMLIWTS